MINMLGTFFFVNIIAGFYFGLCAIVVIETVQLANLLSEKINIWSPLKGIIGGIILIILTFLFSRRYLGLGLDTIQETLRGAQVASTAFIIKRSSLLLLSPPAAAAALSRQFCSLELRWKVFSVIL